MRARIAALTSFVLVTIGLLAPPATAEPAEGPAGHARGKPRSERIVSKPVAVPVRNTNGTAALCAADGRDYEIRGRLVGTRAAVFGRTGTQRLNVLVHDTATGGWFWHLRDRPAYDYATKLAQAGEVSLVLDRLGYGVSPLADGRDTCLGAQADMLRQVVQHVRSGSYAFTGRSRAKDPLHASRVVLHGHGTGAVIAQLEAGTWDDVDGLVLMSWPTSDPASRAARAAQASACQGGASYAALGSSDEEWAATLLRTAPATVRASAIRLRDPDPCGDVASSTGTLLAARFAASGVDVPVLSLSGEQAAPAASYPRGVEVTTHVVPGAGSALPLEASARSTRGVVLDWLRARP